MKLEYWIIGSFALLLVFAIALMLEKIPLSLALVVLSPLVVVALAWRILRDHWQSSRRFDTHFYQDIDLERNH